MHWYVWVESIWFWTEYYGIIFAMAFSEKLQVLASLVLEILQENASNRRNTE